MTEGSTIRLFVLDTGPLITLAAADALDYLTYPSAPVFIPDAVFFEATNKQGSLGAEAILDWAQQRATVVHIVPTNVFANHQQLLQLGPKRREPGLGERAAFEVLQEARELVDPDLAVMISEDAGVIRTVLGQARLSRVIPITTTDYLFALEAAGRINSADAVLAAAEDAGRHASAERALTEAHERGMAALRAVLKPSEGGFG